MLKMSVGWKTNFPDQTFGASINMSSTITKEEKEKFMLEKSASFSSNLQDRFLGNLSEFSPSGPDELREASSLFFADAEQYIAWKLLTSDLLLAPVSSVQNLVVKKKCEKISLLWKTDLSNKDSVLQKWFYDWNMLDEWDVYKTTDLGKAVKDLHL